MATAHGAGLMLLPFMLGLCATVPSAPTGAAAALPELGHAAVMSYLARSNLEGKKGESHDGHDSPGWRELE